MERKTPLYDVHVEEGGKVVPFAGYLLPVQYGTGIKAEHEADVKRQLEKEQRKRRDSERRGGEQMEIQDHAE